MDQWSVKKNLLLIRIHYFLYVAGHGPTIVFSLVYAEQLGISAAAIGIILAVIFCVTVISRPVIGGIVDHFQILKQMLTFLILVNALTVLALNFIPTPYQTPLNITTESILCHQGNLHLVDYDKSECQKMSTNSTTQCLISCSLCQYGSPHCVLRNETSNEIPKLQAYDLKKINRNYPENSTIDFHKTCLNDNDITCTDSCFDGSELCKSVAGTNPFLQLFLLCLLLSFVHITNGSILSLSDVVCYNALGNQQQKYGKLRMWGAVGMGMSAFLAGYLNDVFTQSSRVYSYSPSFYTSVVFFALDLFVIRTLDLNDVSASKSICKSVGSLCFKPRILLFVIGVYGVGVVTGIYQAYFFWYLRTTLRASQLIIGCVTAIQSWLSGIPFYYFSGFIIGKIGHINTVTIAYLAYGIKFLILSFLTNPWWALPVELSQGLCFGSFYSALTSYSKLISPEGTEATVQGIVNGIFEGLGVATGSLLGGFCMNIFGGRYTFFGTGLISFTAGILLWLVHFIMNGISAAHY